MRLLGRGKDVHDAVDGLGSAGRVQGAQHQMAGLRGGERELDGLPVAEFADQDHVRVFAQGRTEGVGKRAGMHTEFALADQTLLRAVGELDRVFDRHDVAGRVPVQIIQHGGQRGRFARTGRPGHQHEAVPAAADGLQQFRQSQLRERRDRGRNRPKHHGFAALLPEHVHAKTAHPVHRARKVDGERLLEGAALGVVHQAVGQVVHRLARQRRFVEPLQVAVEADHGWLAAAQVHVRNTGAERTMEHGVEVCRHGGLLSTSYLLSAGRTP